MRPTLDATAARAQLAAIATETQKAFSTFNRTQMTAARAAAVLREVLHVKMKFTGDRTNYDALENADLAAVLDRRRGLPVALGILYIHAARAAGLSAHGINFPGHFLTGLGTAQGHVAIDPFHGGAALDVEDLQALLPEPRALAAGDLAVLSDRLILARLQNNIVTRAKAAGDWALAARTLETMTWLMPESGYQLMDFGLALAASERPVAAAAALAAALAREPDAPWAAEAAQALAKVKRTLN